MITLSIFLVLFVLALAFFVFFKLLKGVVKAIIAVLLLVVFVLAVFGIVIYIDVTKLKGSFNEDQTVLLSHKGTVVAGFVYSNSKETSVLQTTDIIMLSKEEISGVNSELSNDEYGKDSNKLTLIIDSSYFQGKTVEIMEGKSITVDEQMLDKIFTCEKLSSCTAVLAAAAPELKKEIATSFENEQDLKNKLFFNLFLQETTATKGTFLITGIKEDQIKVYPELATLKLIKLIPGKVFDSVIKKKFDETANQLNESTNASN